MRNLGDALEAAIGELRSKHRSVAAPLGLERKLYAAMRGNRPVRPARPILVWMPALAAAALILLLVLRVPPPSVIPPPPDPHGASLAQPRTQPPFEPVEEAALPQSADSSPRPLPPDDRMSTFLPLPSSEFVAPPQTTSILTIQVRKGDLRQYGLDVPAPLAAELVRVDFVVGEDGLARAMRLVR